MRTHTPRLGVLVTLLLAALALGITPHVVHAVPPIEVERAALVMHGDVLERDQLPYSGWVVERSGGAS